MDNYATSIMITILYGTIKVACTSHINHMDVVRLLLSGQIGLEHVDLSTTIRHKGFKNTTI